MLDSASSSEQSSVALTRTLFAFSAVEGTSARKTAPASTTATPGSVGVDDAAVSACEVASVALMIWPKLSASPPLAVVACTMLLVCSSLEERSASPPSLEVRRVANAPSASMLVFLEQARIEVARFPLRIIFPRSLSAERSSLGVRSHRISYDVDYCRSTMLLS